MNIIRYFVLRVTRQKSEIHELSALIFSFIEVLVSYFVFSFYSTIVGRPNKLSSKPQIFDFHAHAPLGACLSVEVGYDESVEFIFLLCALVGFLGKDFVVFTHA